MRRLAPVLAVLAAWAALAAPAFGGGDNSAVAVNTKDGASVFRLAFDVRRVMNGVVDQTNAAVAYASCERCRTTAIAIQVVLVAGGADTITPENYAIAINESCLACVTVAFAYQIVLGTDGLVRFTPEGNRRLARLRRDLRALQRRELSPEELQAELDTLTGELQDVLRTELEPVRGDDEDEAAEDVDEEPEPEEPVPAPAPEEAPPPAETTETTPPTQTAPESGGTDTAPAPGTEPQP